MNVRELDFITIPVSDLETSRRFYHEVLDLPMTDLPDGRDVAKLQKEYLILDSNEKVEQPISFGVIANDSVVDVNSHLINYDVEVISGPKEENLFGHKVTSFVVLDPDKNKVTISIMEK